MDGCVGYSISQPLYSSRFGRHIKLFSKHHIQTHESNQVQAISSNKKRKVEEINDANLVQSREPALKIRTLSNDRRFDMLSEKCKELQEYFAQLPIENDFVRVEFGIEAFNYDEHQMILVTKEDVTQLLRGACLNISVLQVWMQCLFRICEAENRSDTFSFMCPQFVSSSIVHTEESVLYMSKVMVASQTKRFIFAPYHQDDHWMLLVICPTKDVVIVFDSVKQYRKPLIRPQLNLAFTHYKNAGGKNKGNDEFRWIAATCAQQEGGSNCGYFVMRYMLDIIKQYHTSAAITKDFRREISYTNEEIDEVRTLWAEYVLADIYW